MPADPLTCRELVQLVTEYFDGALSATERLAFERHIAICPPCRGYLVELRRTIELSGSLTVESLPPESRDAMLAVFHDWQGGTG